MARSQPPVRVVEVTAPCRADLAGGTLDIWPLGLLQDDAVTVNVAIPVLVRVQVSTDAPRGKVIHHVAGLAARVLTHDQAHTGLTAAVAFHFAPHGGIRIEVLEQAPVGSGLGGSSAYAVALARALLALKGDLMEDHRLVATLRDLEARVLGTPAGTQDYWAALEGGVLAVHVVPGGEEVERLPVDEVWVGERLSVFFTGIVHHSGRVNWQIYRRRIEEDAGTVEALGAIGRAASRCREALRAGDAAAVGAAIASEWEARRKLAPEVCPPDLAHMIDAAYGAGALAVKAGGAGGGGSLLFWHEPGEGSRITDSLRSVTPDGRPLSSGMIGSGCEVLKAV